MNLFIKKLVRRMQDRRGASLVEYGLLVALIALVMIITIGLLSGSIKTAFKTVTTAIGNAKP